MIGVVRPESILRKASCVKSEDNGSTPSSWSHASPGATSRIRPKVRTSEKRNCRPSVRRKIRWVPGNSGALPDATTSRPVIRRLVTKERPEPRATTAYFPRRRMATIRSPATACSKRRRDGATAIFASRTSADSIVVPTIVRAKPRTIVSTSGSSGKPTPRAERREDPA